MCKHLTDKTGGWVIEISFDKVVSHLFSDSMSLVIHEAPPWLAPSGWILKIGPVLIAGNRCLKLLQRFILSSVAASNWWLWIWFHGKMCLKNISQSLLSLRCSSLEQELECLCLQCSWKLVWNNWIGHMFEVIIMQLTFYLVNFLTHLVAPDVLSSRNSKISLVFKVEQSIQIKCWRATSRQQY